MTTREFNFENSRILVSNVGRKINIDEKLLNEKTGFSRTVAYDKNPRVW